MILKYRAFIDGKFYYFTLRDLSCPLLTAEPDNREIKIAWWLERGNQPDVFTGCQDKNGIDIYSNDITAGQPFPDGSRSKKHVKFMSGRFNIPYLNSDWGIEIIGNTHQNKDLIKC